MKSGEKHSIFVVGIGHAGCQILSKLETDSGFSNSVYVSSVLEDFPHSSKGLSLNINMKIGGSLSIPMIRSLCKEQIDIISDSIKSADCVIITCNPGEKIAAALSPVITKLCHDNDIKCIPVLSMPYDSETHRHFNAGTTLTKIKQYSSNIILIDNDEILESLPRIPISEAFNLIYSKIALSLSSLFSNNTHEIENILEITEDDKYSILSFGESSQEENTDNAVKNALHMLSSTTNTSSISRVLLFLNGNSNLSTTDVLSSVNMIKGQVHESQISHSYATTNNSDTMAVLLSSGLTKTKFDDYDPLASIFNGNNLDDDIEYHIDENLDIPILSE
tara:strand:- start:53 stop:1054 length:1002 start_codon:yes stop_codon:yes gene_type:complete